MIHAATRGVAIQHSGISMEELIFRDIVILFCLSILGVLICHRLHLPSIVGFLLTGVLCGPSALGLIVNEELVDTMADVGVAFLMFSIGMELSSRELVRLKRPLLLGGSAQLLLTVGMVFLLFFWWSGIRLGIVYGCMIALSSTAIVLSLLQQKGQTESPQGRICLAVLIFQDLAIVPMVLIFPLLGGGMDLDYQSMALAIGKGLLVIGCIVLFGKFVLPRLMFSVVSARSRELMYITVMGLCLTVALITYQVGLSVSLGAFLAGLMLAESEYSLNTVESIMPFKEVFTSIFFISVGMLLDVRFFASNIMLILVVSLGIVLLKTAMAIPAVCILRYSMRTALLTGLSLAQVGEFSFVLAQSALSLDIISGDIYQVFLAASILTMVLTPFLVGAAPRVADFVLPRPSMGKNASAREGENPEDRDDEENGIVRDGRRLKNHLIIIGFGIGGQLLARGARKSGIPYIISEMNPDTVARFRSTEPIRHGDAAFPLVLEHLGVSTARVLSILISDPAGGRAIISNARAMNPSLHIVVRTRFLSHLNTYMELGANEVIPEEFETSLEIFARVLNHYLVPRQTIDRYVASIRSENYGMVRRLDMGGMIMESLPKLQLSAFTVEPGCAVAGKTLVQVELRSRHGVTAAGVRRGERIDINPRADTRMEEGDVVFLLAPAEALARASALFRAPRPMKKEA